MTLNSSKVDLDAFVISTPNLVKVTLGPKVFKVSTALLFKKIAFLAVACLIGFPIKGNTPITVPYPFAIMLPPSLKLKG